MRRVVETPNHAVQHLVFQVAYVKEHSGHREFEVQRELVAAVKEMSAERCRAILQWGKNNLGPKADEELKLGQDLGGNQWKRDLAVIFWKQRPENALEDCNLLQVL